MVLEVLLESTEVLMGGSRHRLVPRNFGKVFWLETKHITMDLTLFLGLAGIERVFRLNAGAVNAGPTKNFKRLVLAPT